MTVASFASFAAIPIAIQYSKLGVCVDVSRSMPFNKRRLDLFLYESKTTSKHQNDLRTFDLLCDLNKLRLIAYEIYIDHDALKLCSLIKLLTGLMSHVSKQYPHLKYSVKFSKRVHSHDR